METREKLLKPYKGYIIAKFEDFENQKKVVTYMATTKDGDLIDCKRSLKELKKIIDIFYE